MARRDGLHSDRVRGEGSQPAVVVGIAEADHIDDASIQQFVNSKLHKKLDFLYEEKIFQNKAVGILSIPKQKRPFTLKADYGGLRSNVAYVRRGSSTDEATAEEIIKMDAEDSGRGKPKLELAILGPDSQPLPEQATRRFLRFKKLPDFGYANQGYGVMMLAANRDYWRDAAEYLEAKEACIQIKLSLANRSSFALTHTKLEVSVDSIEGRPYTLMGVDEMPREPEDNADRNLSRFTQSIFPASRQEKFCVDENGDAPVCHIRMGNLLPGEKRWAEDMIAFIPKGPGQLIINFSILAAELPEPIIQERQLEVGGTLEKWGVDEIDAAIG